ncbi:MAG: methenyltetrahydromethanopterin cyclohydrolase [Thermoleophilia bacterium]
MISLNDKAVGVVQRMVAEAESLGVAVSRLSNGAQIVDAGVEAPGSLEAGRLFAEACMGGLGEVQFRMLDLDGLTLPGVEVNAHRPVLACMAAQYAGWAVNVPASATSPPYFAMGSGPARALYRGDPIFEIVDYRDPAETAVLTLESRQLPSAAAAGWIAEKCGVSPDRLYLLVAPTAGLVGSVQIAARIVETGLHKMHEVGFDIHTVLSGFGACPLAPVASDDLQAIGRTNDAVLYGGRAWYTVRTDDALIEQVIEKLPSMASRDYGVPFGELFQRYGGDFYQIDPLLFSPAELAVVNVTSGRTFRAGRIDAAMLEKTLLG